MIFLKKIISFTKSLFQDYLRSNKSIKKRLCLFAYYANCKKEDVKKITVHTEQYFPVYMKPDLHFRLAIAQS